MNTQVSKQAVIWQIAQHCTAALIAEGHQYGKTIDAAKCTDI